MATHEKPDDLKKPLCTYICDCDQFEYASKCMIFLDNFRSLKVWRVQYPSDNSYTCWYVSFNHKEEPYILNFNINPKKIEAEFRHPQYLPDNIRNKLRKNQNWRCLDFNKYTEDKVKEMVSIYLKRIRPAFDENKIKFRKWHPRKTKNPS